MRVLALTVISILCPTFILVGHSASAKPWHVDYADSHLTFTGYQGSDAFHGLFKKFVVTIDFDLEHPEKGSLDAKVDVTSATAGDQSRDSYLPTPDWFNFAVFPEAHFIAKGIRLLPDKSYEAVGSLTIKDVSLPLVLPFTLIKEGDHFRAKAHTTLIRTEYHVGMGSWANEDQVGKSVEVNLDLAVKPE